MVKLTKIYTRGGDDGMTSLTGGERRPKYDLRVETYGTVDELNSCIGLARNHVKKKSAVLLTRIQQDLFDLGADISTATEPAKGKALRITAAQVKRLEQEIDAMNASLKPLNSFVLPGGSEGSAFLHLARTVCRRAERLAHELSSMEKLNTHALHYLNRLSDHFFVMARVENGNGSKDILWVPGANR